MEKRKKDIDTDTEIVLEEEEESHIKGKGDKKLRAELKRAKKEAQEYLAGWQRAKADLINSRREGDEERARFAKFATQDLIEQLLPVLDSFEMALKHTDDAGVEQIYKQLVSVFKVNGVEQVRPEGEAFDPREHDSIETVATKNKKEDGRILEVVQTGYKVHDKIIRAPRVRVGELTQ